MHTGLKVYYVYAFSATMMKAEVLKTMAYSHISHKRWYPIKQ